MAATASAILSTTLGDYLGIAAGIFNGVYDADDNAGYIGDVCGTNFVPPSMGNEDYKADLDAVNLAVRIENSTSSLFVVMNEYYSGLSTYSRAAEFIDNITQETLESQYNAYHTYLTNQALNLGLDGSDLLEYISDRIRTFDLFLENLSHDNNEWDDNLI